MLTFILLTTDIIWITTCHADDIVQHISYIMKACGLIKEVREVRMKFIQQGNGIGLRHDTM